MPERTKRPDWLKIRLRTDEGFLRVRSMIDELRLHTVCTEARCPNIYECWNAGTATFMILGSVCTRRCGFCNVESGLPARGVDPLEPAHVAEAVVRLRLRHAVITSVDRDDLPDGGARHFERVIGAVRDRVPACVVEVLTPDFKKKPGALAVVLEGSPDVFAHNVETVPRVYRSVRPGSSYRGSLGLLRRAARGEPVDVICPRSADTPEAQMVSQSEISPGDFLFHRSRTHGSRSLPGACSSHLRFYLNRQSKVEQSECATLCFRPCEGASLAGGNRHSRS
jgi:lipoate synthase